MSGVNRKTVGSCRLIFNGNKLFLLVFLLFLLWEQKSFVGKFFGQKGEREVVSVGSGFSLANDPRLCYSIREQICVGVWPNPKGFESIGFAKTILIKSRCLDASLVIDGSITYPFNDGAKALLEVQPDDSLLTISID